MGQVPTWVALLFVAFAVIPVTVLSQVFTAWISKKLGVKPADIRKYDNATHDETPEDDQPENGDGSA